jgi:cyclic beta-1,2-glucan synthetase
MSELDARLVRRDDRLMLLLTPPFDQTALEPGYIKGYVPGVRENGAQYTHAAAWAVIAFAMLGDGDKAGELFGMLNPIAHTATPNDVQRYRVEPYVVAGDVCSEAPNAGRGGWTWYTGAAGWLYRTGIEWMLGIRVQGATLRIDPCIPSSWPGYTLALQYRATRYEVEIVNPDGVCRGVSSIVLDGIALADSTGVPLVDDQSTHRVRVVLGPTSVSPNTQSAGARAVHAAAP